MENIIYNVNAQRKNYKSKAIGYETLGVGTSILGQSVKNTVPTIYNKP